ncbi:hypothetical protein [Abyssalbus ytuae]|uniref:Uncharacterized protein n=1 Tax=Abyssalbus ytuae TaxID=2926907 RepID=A0A9E6ZIC9_9FLAO|nr:hypothetical protein [Abyssalbus ytuae]UOB16064.1 hypothetical protein MQE35_09965 [Abyssalbus ytuae]
MRKNIWGLLLVLPLCLLGQNKNTILPANVQIKVATMAAPPEFREEATVMGYNAEGEFITLRKGSNGFICLAPNYKTPKYYASYCYPESLEPLMKRGRQLVAEGRAVEKNEVRAKEYEEGKLKIPEQPSILYAYWGTLENLDQETGEMNDGRRRYVIYVPKAMAKDLGMSNKPNNLGMPWLMEEGTYKAHIMITPPLDHNH